MPGNGDEDYMIFYSKREAIEFADYNEGYILEEVDKNGNVAYYVYYFINQ